MSTTLQMTQGHSSGTPDKQLNYQPTFHTKIQPLPPPKGGGGEQYTEEPISRSQRDKSPPLQPTKKGGGEQYGEEPTSTEPTSEQGARERHRRPASCLKEPHRATSSNSENTERKGNSFHICLPGQAWPTLPLMRYRVGMERRRESTTLQMTQGHSSGTPEQATQLPTHLSHENPTPPPTKRGGGEQYSEESF